LKKNKAYTRNKKNLNELKTKAIMTKEEGNKLIAERFMVDLDGKVYRLKDGSIVNPVKKKTGYYQHVFSINYKQHTRLLHRLVAEKWVPNPNNLPEVNHKDGDKSNNHKDNLEWVDRSQNIRHGVASGLIPATWQGKSGKGHPRSKAVYQCDALGYPIQEFGSVREAAKATGIHHNNIYDNLKNKLRSAGGFIWKYKG
jgi:hypothetical protein